MKCLNTLSSSPTNIGRSFWRLRLLAFCLLFFFMLNASGCVSQGTLEEIKQNTKETALSTKATTDILSKANKDVEGVENIMKIFNKKFDNIPKPEPYRIPEWVKLLGGLIAMLLVPDFAKKAGQGIGGTVSIIKKVIGKK